MSLDKTSQTTLLDEDANKTAAESDEGLKNPTPDSDQEIESEPAAKKKGGALKFVFIILGIVFFLMACLAGVGFYMLKSGQPKSTWEPVGSNSVSETSGGEGLQDESLDELKSHAVVESGEELKSQPTVSSALDGSAGTAASMPSVDQIDEAAEAAKANSLQDERLDSLESLITDLERDFSSKNEESAKTIAAIRSQMNTQANTVINLKREIDGLSTAMAKATSNDDYKDLKDSLVKTEAKLDKVIKDASKNTKNMSWVSFTRLCKVEKELKIGRWSEYCGFDENAKPEQPSQQTQLQSASTNSTQVLNQNPVQLASNSQTFQGEVPSTIGSGVSANQGIPNVLSYQSGNSSGQNRDVCAYASRDWKLALITPSQALLHRNIDGFQTIVETDSTIPGLGRVQMFKSNSYPQYVQFTNGIVCGG